MWVTIPFSVLKNQFQCCERMNETKEREAVQRLSSLIVGQNAEVSLPYGQMISLNTDLRHAHISSPQLP